MTRFGNPIYVYDVWIIARLAHTKVYYKIFFDIYLYGKVLAGVRLFTVSHINTPHFWGRKGRYFVFLITTQLRNWPLPHGHLWEYWPNVIDRRDAVTVHLLLKNALKYNEYFFKIYENLSNRCCLQTYYSKHNFFSSCTVTENTTLRFNFLVKCKKSLSKNHCLHLKIWTYGNVHIF